MDPNVFVEPRSNYPIPCVSSRYIQWDFITRDQTINETLRDVLQFEQMHWDSPFGDYGEAEAQDGGPMNEIERLDWDTLLNEKPDALFAAKYLGFNQPSWDHHVNHYNNYEWWELVEEDVQGCFVKLGWDEAIWNGTNPDGITKPATDSKTWVQLNKKEKSAARCIGFFPSLWDGVPLSADFVVPDKFLCSGLDFVLSMIYLK